MIKPDKPRFAGVALVALLLGGFGLIADDVVEGETRAFDERILLALRMQGHPDTPIGPPWLIEGARDVTALGSFSVLGILVTIIVVFMVMIGERRRALLIAATVIGGSIVNTVLKNIFNRPRPDLTGVAKVFTASFPSGHALVSAVTFLTVGAVLASSTTRTDLKAFYLGVAIFLTLIVGLSRVYLGVHYPTDVLAGWSLGAAWALGCYLLASLVRRSVRSADSPAKL